MVYVEQPNFTQTSIPIHSTATLDMTSLSVSGWKLLLNSCPKCSFRRLLVEFLQNDLTEITKVYSLIGDSQPRKPAGYDGFGSDSSGTAFCLVGFL